MSLFNELKRRNVFRVGIAYIVAAWLLMQIADVVLNNITAPEWVFQVIMLVLGLGFPLALIFAWAFEMTPEGIKKEREVDRSQSITSQTGRKLDFIIMGIMAVALAYFTWDKFGSDEGSEPISDQVTGQVAEPTEDVTSPLLANSIAVLPFANRSNVEDDLFFTDGIHDDLLTQLAKISGLKVISRTSVMEYRDTTKKIPEIAEELGVSSILEGGVQRAGKRIRINAQLIDVTTDEHLWAETFDREMTVENIFDIQSEITRQIVTAVRGELDESEAAALTQTPTSNLEAYEAYLHAKAQINLPDYIEQKFIDAETWAQRAVSLDPEFAQAWAILVETNCQLVWMGMDNAEERIQRASAALEKAILHGPALAETLAARAEYIYRVENDFHRAETAFAEAVKANPGDPRLLIRLGVAQRRAGAFEAAVSSFQLAIELDPANIEGRSLLVGTLNLMGEYRRAEPLIAI
jgi:TolB-like protein